LRTQNFHMYVRTYRHTDGHVQMYMPQQFVLGEYKRETIQ